MISIGNDIVDLKNFGPELHARYIERVFNRKERDFIGDDSLRLWRVWSAKEAAYKTAKRLCSATVFSPKKFEYCPIASQINFGADVFFVKHIFQQEYVYTFCSNQSSAMAAETSHYFGRIQDSQRETEEILNLALIKISEQLQIERSRLKIDKTESNIPHLLIDSVSSNSLLSFSHDGDWMAVWFYAVS